MIHPGGGYLREHGASQEEVFDHQALVLRALAERARLWGITLCVENMRCHEDSAESLLALIKAAGDRHLAICLNTGHLHLTENNNQEQFIRKAGDKLKALHITDNDRSGDQHLIPFSGGTADWKAIMGALSGVGYTGTLNIEIPGDSIHCPLPLRDGKLTYVKQTEEYLLSLLKRD